MSKRILSISLIMLIAVSTLMIFGCGGGGIRLVPLSVKMQNADRKIDAARLIHIVADMSVEERKQLNAEKNVLLDEAITKFTEVITANPDGKYVQRAHFSIAEIYKSRNEWDNAITHYQEVVDRAPTGYLGSRSKSTISLIRKNRREVKEQLRVYRNRLEDNEETQEAAAQALYAIGEAYSILGDLLKAIEFYEKLVVEYPEHELAPRAQFKAGNIYFYQLYDYTNKGGWGAFVKVAQSYKGSFEASQAETLLKTSKQTLDYIKGDQDDINKYTNKAAMKKRRTGAYVLPSELYQMGYRDRIIQDYQNIAAGWIEMKNYPNAIFAYRELAENLSSKKFTQADALYQMGRLYQMDGQLEKAIDAYETFFDETPQSIWRNEAVYQQTVCYQGIREFGLAYEGFKTYMSLDRPEKLQYYRQAEQIVRQMEQDQDQDGFLFYQEQQSGTSDQDADSQPES